MRSPTFTNSGTCTTAPVSSVAGFVTFETVSPRTPGSVSTTASSTAAGSCTPPGRPSTVSICTELDGCRNSSASATEERGSGNCSNVSSSMKTTSSPESYRYWTFFVSVCTRENFSPARKVLSTTAPDSSAFSLVRTNAPPLPGLTCWKSTMRQTTPSSSMCIPFLNWLVLTVSAMASSLGNGHELLRGRGEDLRPVVADDDQVLDADPANARQVDARLDGHDVAGFERVLGLLGQPWRLVHEHPQSVAEAVAELLAVARFLHHVAGRRVRLTAGRSGAHRIQARLLGALGRVVRARELLRELPGCERPRAVGHVPVESRGGVD